jgi:hypothetical protein
MNKYWIIILLFCFSCESIFHEEDNNYIILDKRQEKIDMINGIYSLLTQVHNKDYFSCFLRSDDINHYGIYSFSTKYGGCSSSYAPIIDFEKVIGNIYLKLYTAILSANTLIAQSKQNEDAEILGEAYFLRAYCYFKLARLFGKVPIVTDTEVNFLLKMPSYKEVYEFIEGDLNKALTLLPETYSNARIKGETPNKGTAKAILAEVYLSMAGFPVNDKSKYAESAKLAGEVIEQASLYNYALLDDMANLWKSEYRHNVENVFGLFFDDGTEETNTNIYVLQTWKSFYIPGLKFYANFPDNYRKIESFKTGEYVKFTTQLADTIIFGLFFDKYDPISEPCIFISSVYSFKWANQYTEYENDYNSNVTLSLLRYAQTLLTYAEAKAHIGEPDASAYEAVNKVRRRSNKLDLNSTSVFDLSPNLTQEQFIDSVVWERAWELCFEPDGRWFDIIRLDLKDKLRQYRFNYEVITSIPKYLLSNDWYFYSLPQQDRWLNPNLEDTEAILLND